ncbi:MAG: hypothetical protein ACKOQX_06065 [Actinomycetota bacterium]
MLGVAAGAGLGATFIFTLRRPATEAWWIDPLPLAAFVGGLVAVFATYIIGSAFNKTRSTATQGKDKCCTQSRAGRDTQQIRIDERVAKNSLITGARN